MGNGKQIQVLLSTYNGARYLKEQITSIIAQNCFDDCCVLIRDDGSTDGTIEILEEYKNHPQFRIILGENIGITGSYFWLLQNANDDVDYYAFSDQDDIWLPEKLSMAANTLNEYSEKDPLLFATLSRIVDEKGDFLYNLPIPRRGVSYYNAMIQNVLPGHTQVFNRTMRQLVLERGIDNIHVIDWWYYLVASGVGKIVFVPEYTVLHREHSNNAIGMTETWFQNLSRRIGYIRQGRGNAFARQLEAFYRRYSDLLPEEYKIETEGFLRNLPTLLTRIGYVAHCKAYRQNIPENLLFRLLYVIGKYKL